MNDNIVERILYLFAAKAIACDLNPLNMRYISVTANREVVA